MKIQNVFFPLVLVIVISSCSRPQNQGNDILLTKIQGLENKVDDLQNQLDDQKLKTRISFMQISSNPIFNTPFEDFVLASDDFFNNPVDVGLFECARRCAKEAKTRLKSCAVKPDGEEKRLCYSDSSKKAGNCQQNCQTRFPPKFK